MLTIATLFTGQASAYCVLILNGSGGCSTWVYGDTYTVCGQVTKNGWEGDYDLASGGCYSVKTTTTLPSGFQAQSTVFRNKGGVTFMLQRSRQCYNPAQAANTNVMEMQIQMPENIFVTTDSDKQLDLQFHGIMSQEISSHFNYLDLAVLNAKASVIRGSWNWTCNGCLP